MLLMFDVYVLLRLKECPYTGGGFRLAGIGGGVLCFSIGGGRLREGTVSDSGQLC